MSDWTYPRKIELVACLWRDIIKGDLVLHDNQIKRVDAIEDRMVDEIEPTAIGSVRIFHIFVLAFHDKTTLARRWKEGEHETAIFLRVPLGLQWDINKWSTC